MPAKDGLKVIVLGNASVGKTLLIQWLINSRSKPYGDCSSSSSTSTTSSEMSSLSASSGDQESASPDGKLTSMGPFVGLDLYEWVLPVGSCRSQAFTDGDNADLIKITVWDFTGNSEHFHSLQEIFFTPQTLFVVVWDMAASTIHPKEQERCCQWETSKLDAPQPGRCTFGDQPIRTSYCSSAFRLDYDSDSDSDADCDVDVYNQEEIRRLQRALNQDIDNKVQTWIDRIQARVPGATILPVATFADCFRSIGDSKEAKKRCKMLKERLLCNEDCRVRRLHLRLCEDTGVKGGSHQESCKWVQSFSHRPKILFGSRQDDDQLLPHQVSCRDGMGFRCFREFVLTQAKAVARLPSMSNGSTLTKSICSISTKRVLRDTCRSIRNHFKAVQAQYFFQQYQESTHCEIYTALDSLQQSGEILCFQFRAMGKPCNFVVLDPVWMVNSMSFLLSKGICESNAALDIVAKSSVEDLRSAWNQRSETKYGLELARQVSSDATDRFFDLIVALLTHHDVIVPTRLLAGSLTMFMPSRLRPRDFHNGCDSPCVVNCPLLHLGAAGVFASSVCHGLTFMKRVPDTLMERFASHALKLFESLEIKLLDFRFWKDSCILKVSSSDDESDKKVEIQSFLLQSPVNDDTSSHAVSCKSMFVSCIRGFAFDSIGDVTKRFCLLWRRAIEKALDDLPWAEYKDEGVCPQCLAKPTVGGIGTWPVSKLISAMEDEETFIRCRNGHCVDIGMARTLILCQLFSPQPDYQCCKPSKEIVTLAAPNELENTSHISRDSSITTRARKTSFDHGLDTTKCCRYLRRSKTEPDPLDSSSSCQESGYSTLADEDFDAKILEVKKVLHSFEASTKKRFFGMKKQKLVLSNLQLREAHLPLKDLVDTPLGLNVQSLNLSRNLFESLPSSLVLSLPNLKSLDLSYCCLSKLPEKWDMPMLKKLNLSNNNLTSFPSLEMLRGLPELEELNISGNYLKTAHMPSNGHVLQKLKVLDISANQISSLPKDFGKLPSLKMFDIQHNPIKQFPVDIVSCMNGFYTGSTKEISPRKLGKKTKVLEQRASGPRVKEISLSRTTQNTVPIDDVSERDD